MRSGGKLLSLEVENTSDFERQNTIEKPMNSTSVLEENYVTHEKMMELEPLLEASGERNPRSINLTHGECPCHCLAQTVWYPEHSNLCLIWDVEELRSIGLPDHRPKVTPLVVSSMLALQWMEKNVTKYRESKTPTAESINAIDYSRRLELFETACKVFAIPMGQAHVEPHKILPMVSGDIDVLVIRGDEGSHEEASEIISTVPGSDRAGSLQKTLANPS